MNIPPPPISVLATALYFDVDWVQKINYCNVLPMVWRVTNEPVDCRPSRGTNKHTQDRKRCSLLDDNSTATADYDSAHANYTVNYIRQLQNHDYIHMTTTTSYKSILLHVTLLLSFQLIVFKLDN